MSTRGGPQRIPRPDDARPGGPPPWAHVDGADVSLSAIERRLAARRARVVGRSPGSEHRRSAVLVPLYEAASETWVVLTRRSPHLRSHTHEVSFPGGRIDAADPTPWATALREANEEVDLDTSLPRRIGELDSFVTGGSQSFVTPYVGALPERPRLTPAEEEVERILHVPLSEFMLPEVFREELWSMNGQPHRAVTFFELYGDTVWGATAAMLRQLLAIATGTDETISR